MKDYILKRYPVIYTHLSQNVSENNAKNKILVTNPERHADKQCGLFAITNGTVSPRRRLREAFIHRSHIPAPNSDVKCPPDVHFFHDGTLPRTALASADGAGNTWTRHLLQVATGKDMFISPSKTHIVIIIFNVYYDIGLTATRLIHNWVTWVMSLLRI